MKTLVIAAALTTTALVSTAYADDRHDPHCGNVQIDKWMSEAQVRERATALGIEVREVDIDDGCYEVEGRNKDGRRIEVRFHPETGEQVSVDGD
jgi:hypothetical protein